MSTAGASLAYGAASYAVIAAAWPIEAISAALARTDHAIPLVAMAGSVMRAPMK